MRCPGTPGTLLKRAGLVRALDQILKAVTEIENASNPKCNFDKLRAYIRSQESSAAELKMCHDRLDWAAKEFDVSNSGTRRHNLPQTFISPRSLPIFPTLSVYSE